MITKIRVHRMESVPSSCTLQTYVDVDFGRGEMKPREELILGLASRLAFVW